MDRSALAIEDSESGAVKSPSNLANGSQSPRLSGEERTQLEQLARHLTHRNGTYPGATALGQALATSGEFYDHRRYAVGDDARRIDWNVWRRNRQLVVRSSRRHREQDVIIVLDASSSMSFFDKFVTAQRLSLALSYLMLAVGFRLRVCWPASGGTGLYCSRRLNRSASFLTLEKDILQLTANGPTSLGSWLAGAPIDKHAHLLVVSDFLSPNLSSALKQLPAHGALTTSLFHVESREEVTPGRWLPTDGDLQLEDSETGELMNFTASALSIGRYNKWRKSVCDTLLDWRKSPKQYYQHVLTSDEVLAHASLYIANTTTQKK